MGIGGGGSTTKIIVRVGCKLKLSVSCQGKELGGSRWSLACLFSVILVGDSLLGARKEVADHETIGIIVHADCRSLGVEVTTVRKE